MFTPSSGVPCGCFLEVKAHEMEDQDFVLSMNESLWKVQIML